MVFHRSFLSRSTLILPAAICTVLLYGSALQSSVANAQAVGKGITNLELPRFVSLKARKANLRVGPGKNYAIAWRYLKRNVPLEVVQEFDTWRKVRDSEGSEGWVHRSLIQGKRTIIMAPWNRPVRSTINTGAAGVSDETAPDPIDPSKIVMGYASPDANSLVSIRFEPGVIASVDRCDGKWCRIKHSIGTGWVKQVELWGVYPDETVGD